jgi:hypothetical protein
MEFINGLVYGTNLNTSKKGVFPKLVIENHREGKVLWRLLRDNMYRAMDGEWERRRVRDGFWKGIVENYRVS